MAWGKQGGNGRGSKNVKSAWAKRNILENKLEELRLGKLSRCEAYNLFCGEKRIKGLGPAYWTKLLYFFDPSQNFYIMDQFTSKSINLLTGIQIVRMDGNSVSAANKCGNYQAYCEEIDEIALSLNESGENVEEMLMSGKGKPWRLYLKNLEPRYEPEILRKAYSHISKGDF
jgi:hypothetical protein